MVILQARGPAAVAALGLVMMLAGCGTTVPLGAGSAAGGGSLGQGAPSGSGAGGVSAPNTLGGPSSGLPAGGVAAVGGTGSLTGPGGTVNRPGSAAADTVGGPARGATGVSTGVGPGVTRTTINVGVPYTSNGDAANAALGAAAITRGNEKDDMRAVIEDINANGGVAGRRLVPVYYAYDAQSADSRDSQDQAACETFTRDNKVFAVFGGGLGENFDACMQKAGVLKLSSGRLIDEDRAYFRKYPTLFNLSVPSQDRMMADQVDTLRRLGYFTGWNPAAGEPGPNPVKIGVLSIDTPTWSRPLRSVLLPALKSIGFAVDPANVYEVYNPQSDAEISRTTTDIQNATLKFQSNGVTHVIMLDANASLTLLFAPGAKNQRYYPRLGMNSATGAQALKDAGVIGNDQLNGAVGLGWFPSLDVPAAETKKYATAETRRCLQVMKERTGQSFDSTNAASLALTKCDMGYFFDQVATGAGPRLNLQQVVASIEAVGGSYKPALVPASFVSSAQHDAITQGYDMRWNTACSCTRYAGQHRIP